MTPDTFVEHCVAMSRLLPHPGRPDPDVYIRERSHMINDVWRACVLSVGAAIRLPEPRYHSAQHIFFAANVRLADHMRRISLPPPPSAMQHIVLAQSLAISRTLQYAKVADAEAVELREAVSRANTQDEIALCLYRLVGPHLLQMVRLMEILGPGWEPQTLPIGQKIV